VVHAGNDVSSTARRFRFDGAIEDIAPFGTGHINDTFRVRTTSPRGPRSYLLQRINHFVFKEPEKVMENFGRVTAHLRAKIVARGGAPEREALTLVPTADEGTWLRDEGGNYWRMLLFIEGARTYDTVGKPEDVRTAARAFGLFQHMLSDLDPKVIHETIPNFHNTPWRFEQFVQAVDRDTHNRASGVRDEIDFLAERENDTAVFARMAREGTARQRVVHNDTKLNNVMIDDATREAVCVVDLDTVMPGLSMYDFGDCCRIATNPAAEDEKDLSKVRADMSLFRLVAEGYLDAARAFLLPTEIDKLAFSARLITLEQAIRFLTDHLQGDVYYKVHREGHNADRCRTQLALVQDMERKTEEMEGIVREVIGRAAGND
jgi:hypothetical protein